MLFPAIWPPFRGSPNPHWPRETRLWCCDRLPCRTWLKGVFLGDPNGGRIFMNPKEWRNKGGKLRWFGLTKCQNLIRLYYVFSSPLRICWQSVEEQWGPKRQGHPGTICDSKPETQLSLLLWLSKEHMWHSFGCWAFQETIEWSHRRGTSIGRPKCCSLLRSAGALGGFTTGDNGHLLAKLDGPQLPRDMLGGDAGTSTETSHIQKTSKKLHGMAEQQQ